MSWLRLQSPIDCIPHPYYIYTMCFITLICCGWTCGCTPTRYALRTWLWIFGKLGLWLSLSDAVLSWLRLQSPADYIPHPYHIHTMCFSTLICCGWTCGYTLTLICLRKGCGYLVNFLEMWGMGPTYLMWLHHGYASNPTWSASQINIIYI